MFEDSTVACGSTYVYGLTGGGWGSDDVMGHVEVHVPGAARFGLVGYVRIRPVAASSWNMRWRKVGRAPWMCLTLWDAEC